MLIFHAKKTTFQSLFSGEKKKNITSLLSAEFVQRVLTLVLLKPEYLAFANSVDPDQLASEKANWSGSALFAIQYVNLYQQSGLNNMIGWQLEMGVASKCIQHDKG